MGCDILDRHIVDIRIRASIIGDDSLRLDLRAKAAKEGDCVCSVPEQPSSCVEMSFDPSSVMKKSGDRGQPAWVRNRALE